MTPRRYDRRGVVFFPDLPPEQEHKNTSAVARALDALVEKNLLKCSETVSGGVGVVIHHVASALVPTPVR